MEQFLSNGISIISLGNFTLMDYVLEESARLRRAVRVLRLKAEVLLEEQVNAVNNNE